MLSFKEAKALIEAHEKIEKKIEDLAESKRKIEASIKDELELLAKIEAKFSPEKKEEAAEKVNDEAIKRFKELSKKAFTIVKEEPKEAVEAPKAVSPYRIKGDK